jgi:hypothetical protein
MNVLVIESEVGSADADAEALSRAGNVVFRCFPDSWGTNERHDPFQCIGVTEGACPLDCGVDVAVMRTDGEYPSIFTAGSLCAMRRGIPVAEVEHGQNAVAVAEGAVEDGYEALRTEIRWRIAPLLSELELRGDAIDMHFETIGPDLYVSLLGPKLADTARQRVASRVADAISTSQRVFSKTSVTYRS